MVSIVGINGFLYVFQTVNALDYLKDKLKIIHRGKLSYLCCVILVAVTIVIAIRDDCSFPAAGNL